MLKDSKLKWTLIGIGFVFGIIYMTREFYVEQTVRMSLKKFKKAELYGSITSIKTSFSMTDFTIDNKVAFTFSAGVDPKLKKEEVFYMIAEKGDSIFKYAGSDTFTLRHKDEFIDFVITIPQY
jgi:hypothetical protein